MHGSRRGSVETCSTEASSEHVIAESERTLGHSTSTLPSTPLASSSSPSRANWKQMARESPHDFTISANYSTTFSCVSLDPPISQAVLSEIDIQRFKGDLFLRHHLNFEPRVEIRVSTQEPQAEERRERAREYWHTLAIEIAFCSAHCQRIAGNPSSRPLRIFPPGTTLRLPRLFAAVRDMLKRSLPFKEWSIIDERLDVSFLMQQLERGDCEFVALSDWLGNFLRQFCSPAQGYLLHTMTSAIRFGIENANVESTVHGLIIMLEILQEMTLVSCPTVLILDSKMWSLRLAPGRSKLFTKKTALGLGDRNHCVRAKRLPSTNSRRMGCYRGPDMVQKSSRR